MDERKYVVMMRQSRGSAWYVDSWLDATAGFEAWIPAEVQRKMTGKEHDFNDHGVMLQMKMMMLRRRYNTDMLGPFVLKIEGELTAEDFEKYFNSLTPEQQRTKFR